MQRVINKISGDLEGNGVEVYIDDIVIHAKEETRHGMIY